MHPDRVKARRGEKQFQLTVGSGVSVNAGFDVFLERQELVFVSKVGIQNS